MHFLLREISTGHVVKGMRKIKLTAINIIAENIKMSNLYFNSNENQGNLISIELNSAPMPTKEKIIGRVQQNNVLIDVIKANHVRLNSPVLFI